MATPTPKKVLIIEDERDIAQLVKLYLEKEGFRATIAATGVEGLNLITTAHPDMVILDLMLPEIDGLEICKKIRSVPATKRLLVLMLTAKVDESDTIIGLELGADDYLTKPFSPKVLVSRVKTLFRRVERTADSRETSFAYGPLRLDLARHEARVDNQEVQLTAKEFGLLQQFLQQPGRVLTRDALLNAVWGYDYYGTTRTVDVHIRRLKLKIPLLDEAIISVKSLGYKLADHIAEK